MNYKELKKKLQAAQMANAGAQKVINDLRNDNYELKSHIARLTSENEKLTDKLNREIIKNRDIKSDYKRMGELCDIREKEHAKDVLKLRRELDMAQLDYETQEDNVTHYRDELEKTKATAGKYRKIAVENYEKIMQLQGESPRPLTSDFIYKLGFDIATKGESSGFVVEINPSKIKDKITYKIERIDGCDIEKPSLISIKGFNPNKNSKYDL